MAEFLLILPVLLFSVVAHEYAHAWTAYRQGDTTALERGRLTLNPVPHIDPIMSVLVPLALWFLSQGTFTFGAARPVPVEPARFRNFRRGDLIVSSAGIVTNCGLAVLCTGAYVLIGLVARQLPAALDVAGTLQRMAGIGISINILLAYFNLVPLPPLDGSRLLFHALPARWGTRYRALAPAGFAVLLLVMIGAPTVFQRLLWPAAHLTQLTEDLLVPWTLARLP